MKNRILYFLASIVLIGMVASCELIDDAINISFETDFVNIDFTVNPAAAGVHTLHEELTPSDLQQQIEEHGGDVVSLDAVTIYEAILSVETEGITLDPFEWVEVYVSTEDIDLLLIGSATITSAGLLEVDLDLTETDLMSIINADEYLVTIKGSLGETLTVPVDMLLKLRYSVVV